MPQREKAIGRQKDLAKKRFDVGLAAITEVQETQAAYDLTVVSRIARESQHDTARNTHFHRRKGDKSSISTQGKIFPSHHQIR